MEITEVNRLINLLLHFSLFALNEPDDRSFYQIDKSVL